MTLEVRRERDISFEETAALAAEGFGMPPGSFRPERLRWLYERAFSNGTTVLSLYAQDRKVGQVALIHQYLRTGEGLEKAIALVDLFILKAFRSRQAMADLYGEVERFCGEASIRFILAVPNQNGARVNVRYLRLVPLARLDIRAGLCRPWSGRRIAVSAPLDQLGRAGALAHFSRFLPSETAGLVWTPETLWERFQNGEVRYSLHATDDVLLIASPRTSRGLPHTLFCALFARPGSSATKEDIASVGRAACAMHRRPLFVYAGVNRDLPLPGRSLPERLRPSPMMVQIRDFEAPETPIEFSRFELLDFDFA